MRQLCRVQSLTNSVRNSDVLENHRTTSVLTAENSTKARGANKVRRVLCFEIEQEFEIIARIKNNRERLEVTSETSSYEKIVYNFLAC